MHIHISPCVYVCVPRVLQCMSKRQKNHTQIISELTVTCAHFHALAPAHTQKQQMCLILNGMCYNSDKENLPHISQQRGKVRKKRGKGKHTKYNTSNRETRESQRNREKP